MAFNSDGQWVEAKDLKLKSPEYGEVLPDGRIIVHWKEEDDTVDGDGFDKSYEGSDGYYDEVILPIGSKLCRYGTPAGYLTAPIGTPYEHLGLPYIKETREYHEYRVVADNCKVKRGKVSPMFDSPGGGTQYLHPETIEEEEKKYHKVEEDFEWLEKLNGRKGSEES